jgi:hypothetical protein
MKRALFASDALHYQTSVFIDENAQCDAPYIKCSDHWRVTSDEIKNLSFRSSLVTCHSSLPFWQYNMAGPWRSTRAKNPRAILKSRYKKSCSKELRLF